MNMPRLVDYTGNGERATPTFSADEMKRRHDALRALMTSSSIDAVLMTSYQNICYLSDFLYCRFGRRYGLVIDHDHLTSISAGIDGGQPARRTTGHNVTYTDWQHDNYFHAAKQLIGKARRIGIEFDHVDLEFKTLLGIIFRTPNLWTLPHPPCICV